MRSSTENDEELPSPREVEDEARGASALAGAAANADGALDVVSDITSDFPIGPAELDVLERYFGDLLDIVLGGSKNAPVTLSRHIQKR